MPAVLFGSISTLADTSEVQRRAFNQAFATHGLDWEWSRDDYISMLGSNGGTQRIADYAAQRDQDVDADAVHDTKSRAFQQLLAESEISARPGVVETIDAAKRNNLAVGFVTTTSRANIEALLQALAPHVTEQSFDVIIDADDVDATKPDPAAYNFALRELGTTVDDAVAVEDNVGGVAAAAAAGIRCVAFPNANTVDSDFGDAVETVDELDPNRVLELSGVSQ